MKFPDRRIDDMMGYAEMYFSAYARAVTAMDRTALAKAADVIIHTIAGGGAIYACGNGGSAAISNHLLCDFAKGIQTNTVIKPRVISLSSHTELILAIGNDIAFEEVFAYQVRSWIKANDLLMTISSSGNSENIVRAMAAAKEVGAVTIALTGFTGGRAREAADIPVHVDCNNYGVVEDIHQSVMHCLAQYIRQRYMDSAAIAANKF